MGERRGLSYEGEGEEILQIISEILSQHGYSDKEWRVAKDGAPGWAAWYYWIDIDEDPARPVKEAIDTALAAARSR